MEGISGSGFQCSGIQFLGGRYENGRVYGNVFQEMKLQPQGQGTYGQDLAGFVMSIILGLTIMCSLGLAFFH